MVANESLYREQIDELVGVCEEESDDIGYGIRRVKKDLMNDDSCLVVDIKFAIEQIENTVDNLKEVITLLEEIMDESNRMDEQRELEREEYEEYLTRHQRMFSLP